MTGFGKSTCQLPSKKITIEIKSLNSKQLDLSSRVPSVYREAELTWRNILAAKLQRGKVDLSVTVENFGESELSHLNNDALGAYKRQIEDSALKLGIDVPADWFSILMRFPEVMVSVKDTQIEPEELASVRAAIESAADALMEYRRAEGIKLEEFFAVRIARITELLAEIPQFEQERTARIKERLADSLSKIPAVEYDKGRLEQEMIFYIEKLDVNEERQRLAQHLTYFTETMNLPAAGQGKKLGFIAQEMGREINTLGSKSNHAEMQRIVVMMKDELEQIKEQVLNVM